jgi:hypothetical protein
LTIDALKNRLVSLFWYFLLRSTRDEAGKHAGWEQWRSDAMEA